MGFKRMWPGQKIADVARTTRGLEAVWDKAIGYVTKEPYRTLLAKRLAEFRFYMAVSRDQMTIPEALAKLALARATSPEKISALAYSLGYASIVLPGGTYLVRSRGLRMVRRLLALLFRFRKPDYEIKRVSI
jgi:hypothetical protein